MNTRKTDGHPSTFVTCLLATALFVVEGGASPLHAEPVAPAARAAASPSASPQASPANPARAVISRPGSLPGAYEATLALPCEVRERDVFTVRRGSASPGEVMVMRIKGNVLVVFPRASFKGQLMPGDTLEFARSAPPPRDLSRAPAASQTPVKSPAPTAGAGAGVPGQAPTSGYQADRLDNSTGPIAVTRMGFVQNKSVNYGKEFFGEFEIANLSEQAIEKVAIIIETDQPPDRREIGTMKPKSRHVVYWARQRAKWETLGEVMIEVEYLLNGVLQRISAKPRKHAPGTPEQGAPGMPPPGQGQPGQGTPH